jgi:ribonuclease HI
LKVEDEGWYTFKVDGSYRGRTEKHPIGKGDIEGEGGIGGVLEDPHGNTLMGFCDYFPKGGNSFVMEAKAIHVALRKVLTIHPRPTKLMVLSDHEKVIDALNLKCGGFQGQYKKYYKKILAFHDKIPNLVFKSIDRDDNNVVDGLAKLGMEKKRQMDFKDRIPEDLEKGKKK